MTYGRTPPAVTPSYSGFVNNDSATSLTTPPSCSTTATSSSPPSNYLNSCSGATDPNYDITFPTGVTTVTPAPVDVAVGGTQAWGGSPGFTAIAPDRAPSQRA